MKTIKKKHFFFLLTFLLLLSSVILTDVSDAAEDQSDEEKVSEMILAYLNWVDECDIELTAGNSTAHGELDFTKRRHHGYLKTGLSAFYMNRKIDMYLFDAKIMTGSSTFLSWCTCEVGLRAIYGNETDSNRSDDLGAVALAAQLDYTVPEYVIAIPLRLSGGIMYSSEVASFFDMKHFLALQFGIEVPFAKRTSILFNYNYYNIKTSTIIRDFNNDMFELGLAFHF